MDFLAVQENKLLTYETHVMEAYNYNERKKIEPSCCCFSLLCVCCCVWSLFHPRRGEEPAHTQQEMARGGWWAAVMSGECLC